MKQTNKVTKGLIIPLEKNNMFEIVVFYQDGKVLRNKGFYPGVPKRTKCFKGQDADHALDHYIRYSGEVACCEVF